MALDKSTLQSALYSNLKTIFEDLSSKSADDAAIAMAQAMADAIDIYVKTGSVTFTAGTITGACPPLGGPLTGGTGAGGTIT